MPILKLKPAMKSYLWGGRKLVDEYNQSFDGDILAEAWELSGHPDGECTLADGEYEGMTLSDYIKMNGIRIVGVRIIDKKASGDDLDFPILIKLIDAKADLSIQVHPDEEYAIANEGQHGKYEAWFILNAEPDAYIYYGFSKTISKEEFRQRIENNTLTEVLRKVMVNEGDIFFIPPGTIHAIGAGCVIAEVQQSSNVTYRVFDYGRKGPDGKLRTLHIDKALDVTNTNSLSLEAIKEETLSCPYFVTKRIKVHSDKPYEITVTEDSFVSVLVVDGRGDIKLMEECPSDSKLIDGSADSEQIDGSTDDRWQVEDLYNIRQIIKGDSLFVPAGRAKVLIEGDVEMLITTV